MRQYLRRVRIEVEDSDRAVLIVEQLRVVFDLRQAAQPSQTPSTVRIWNLGKASASHIAERGQVVRVFAGYDDIKDATALASGEIRRVLHEPNGLDRITTIVLGGSDSALSGATLSLSVPGPASLHDVLERIVDEIGLQIGPLDAVPDEELTDGYLHNGGAKVALSGLLEPRGLTFYEVAGEIHFGGTVVASEFLLDTRSGLIGSPSVTDNDGAKAKMALNSSIELGQTVEIRSVAVNGWYSVTSVVHRGDNWGGEFVTEIEGTRATPELEGRPFARNVVGVGVA